MAETTTTDAGEVLRALAEPTRLQVFRSLLGEERCVRDLTEVEGLAQPLVSHHLAVLVAAGLVRPRRSGAYTMYAADPDGIAAARASVLGLLAPEALPPRAHPGGNPSCCR